MTIIRSTILLLFVLHAPLAAQTSYPMLMSLKPVAAQVGKSSMHTVNSRYSLLGAYEVLVTGKGVKGEVVPIKSAKGKKAKLTALKVRFTIADDAMPGVRDFRIATPQGASTIGQLVVVGNPVVSEKGNNDAIAKAQSVKVPATICGAIESAEDVDHYKFSAKAGQSLYFHVRSMRLQNRIHDLQQHSDPILTLRTARGVTLAASDNYFHGDPFISHTFQEAGEFVLEIRDVRYQGNRYWEYSIEVSDRPFITTVFPMGVKPGVVAKVELIGSNVTAQASGQILVADSHAAGPLRVRVPFGKFKTNPVSVVVGDADVIAEQDTNNDQPGKSQRIAIPSLTNGRIERESDVDCYEFAAGKGERFSFEIIARREGSSLDSHLRILNAKGRQLQLNDDLRYGKRSHADSWIENWAAPADGKYYVEVRDLHLRGGRSFVYVLKAERAEPYFELFADTDKTQLTPGTSGIIFVRAVRKNGFNGEIQLNVSGLPASIRAECGRILADGQDGCIVLTAAAKTKLCVKNIAITGSAKMTAKGQSARQLSARALTYQETYQPGGGRGHWPVEMHTVSVGAPSDIRAVKLSTYDIKLKPGQSKRIEVTVERSSQYNRNVTLDVIYKHLSSVYGNSMPAGVSLEGSKSKTLLTGKATKGFITLKAAATAKPAARQQIAVMANVSINFVMKATYASRPLLITVEGK